MGRYQITAPDGRIVTVEGAAPPTQEDAAEIFSRLPPKQTSPGVLERFNSRLPTAGITEVPGAVSDIADAGPLQAVKSLVGGVAGTVGDYVAGNLAVGDTYTRMRERGQSPVYSAIASTPFLGPAADVITQDIVQGRVPEMAGDLVSMAPMALGAATKASNRMGRAATASAEKSMSQALGATTKDLKQLSERIVPELVKREPVALTRKSLQGKFGVSADAARTALDEALAKVPPGLKVDLNKAYKSLDDLKAEHQIQSATGDLIPANASAAATIKAIDSLQESLLELDPKFESVRKFRQILDKQIAAGGKAFGRTITEGTVLDVTREGANAVRNVLSEATPNIAKLNRELSFWLNAKQVLGATIERTASQGTPLGVTMAQGAGVAGSLASGGGIPQAAGMAAMLGGVKQIVQSTGWRTAGSMMKHRLARALMNNNPGEIMAIGQRVAKRPILPLLMAQPQPSPEP